MIEVPNEREDALDIIWGVIHNENDRWNRVIPGTHGTSRHDICRETGWNYTKVYRLVNTLLQRGQLKMAWNHQHRSNWEGLLSIAEPGDLETGRDGHNG